MLFVDVVVYQWRSQGGVRGSADPPPPEMSARGPLWLATFGEKYAKRERKRETSLIR